MTKPKKRKARSLDDLDNGVGANSDTPILDALRSLYETGKRNGYMLGNIDLAGANFARLVKELGPKAIFQVGGHGQFLRVAIEKQPDCCPSDYGTVAVYPRWVP